MANVERGAQPAGEDVRRAGSRGRAPGSRLSVSGTRVLGSLPGVPDGGPGLPGIWLSSCIRKEGAEHLCWLVWSWRELVTVLPPPACGFLQQLAPM